MKSIFLKRVAKKHIASVHENKKPFTCENCDEASSVKGNMKEHIESVHGGKKQSK